MHVLMLSTTMASGTEIKYLINFFSNLYNRILILQEIYIMINDKINSLFPSLTIVLR